MAKHRIIRVSTCNNLRLFCANLCGCLYCKFCWSKRDKFQRLYEQSDERIARQLDVVTIMQNIHKLRILLKNSLLSPEVNYLMHHSEKFLIDLDNLDSESSEEIIEEESADSSIESNKVENPVFNISRANSA